jgi:molecular chaperone GrpE
MSEENNMQGQEEQKAGPAKSDVDLLNEKISDLERQTAQLKDQVLRKAAEFDNYKRRTENDFAALTKFAGENIISQLLPVLDDFNRSLKTIKDKSENDSFIKGIEMIYAKLLKVLEAQGLKTMDVVGKEFSVDLHDALMQMPRADVPPHTVLEEVDKGYMLFDKVIRHAKVVVSATPSGEVVPQSKTDEDYED